MKQKKTMADLLLSLESDTRPLMTVFEDFINMLVDGITFGADVMQRTERLLERYRGRDAQRLKETLLQFQVEYDARNDAGECMDVIGEFYETHLCGEGASPRFLPWEWCQEIAASIEQGVNSKHVEHATADPCCGSGRLLLAHMTRSGAERPLLGIDPDPLCVKMTALNLWLKGAFMGEIMCADQAKGPDHFAFSYRLSLIPHGLLHITKPQDSGLWHVNREVFSKRPLPSDLGDDPRVSVHLIKFGE